MPKRKGISQKTRFEVFKRDKFTCQYCGASAPEFVLHIDHIIPVVSGGDNNIMNLITACKSCNAGKSYRELSDQSTLEKQRRQIEDLQERKEQLELLARWRDGLKNLETETEKIIESEINKYLNPKWSISEHYKANFRRWLRKFTLKEILIAIDTSSSLYLKPDKNGYTQSSVDDFLFRIPKDLSLNRLYDEKPYMKNVFYVRAVGKNVFNFYDNDKLVESKNVIQKVFEDSLSSLKKLSNTEVITEQELSNFCRELSEGLKQITISSRSYRQWLETLQDLDCEVLADIASANTGYYGKK
jgi:DNA-binding transcriptional regulator GbsR (MarR family)